MESEEQILNGLTRVTTEFFHISTSNQRKREIEEQLEQFGNQIDVWRSCLYAFGKTENQYVWIYCLQVLEKLVNKMWLGIDASAKTQIRGRLFELLLLHHKNFPFFITNKLIKVIVDIGRLDWPMFYPDFLNNIFRLVSDPKNEVGDTRAVGLIALRITSEEFTAPREDISASKKSSLREQLLGQVHIVLKLCSDTLDSQWHVNILQQPDNTMATPPPSPGSNCNNLSDIFEYIEGSNPLLYLTSNSLSQHSVVVAKSSLQCLSQYFSWIPLSNYISIVVVNSIFRYARLGLCKVITNASKFEIATDALVCINELISKNGIPQSFESYLIRIFRQMFHLLQQITSDDQDVYSLEQLDENYLTQFLIFLRLFANLHFTRLESNPNFPFMKFLNLLLQFTFRQTDPESYLQCLEIWEILIDFVSDKISIDDRKKTSQQTSVLKRYDEGLTIFGKSLLQRIQFIHNHSQLNLLDNRNLEDDGHTEWENYLIKNLELIASLTILLPNQMVPKMLDLLEESASVFISNKWHLASVNDLQLQLIWCIRDLATSLQALGRISEIFLSENFRERYSIANNLVIKLLHISHHCSQIESYPLNEGRVDSRINEAVIEVHAQVLATLQPYTHWLSQLYSEAQQIGESQAHLSELLKKYIDNIIPVFNKQVPAKILKAAACTFSSIVSTVRATFLPQIPTLEAFFYNVTRGGCNQLDMQTQLLIFETLSNLLLLPWPNTPECEQKWEGRSQSHATFLQTLLTDFAVLGQNIDKFRTDSSFATSVKPTIHRAIAIMNAIVDSVKQEVIKSRAICYASLHSYIDLSLQLIDVYINLPDTSEVLMSFYLTLFTSLRRQIGPEVVARMIQNFLHIFTTQQLQESILHENQAGVRVVDRFIKILELVIDENGPAFKGFTPSVIVLAVEQIYPIVREKPFPDLKSSFYGLLHRILSRRHRYFFPSPVLQSLLLENDSNSAGGNRKIPYTISHKQQFMAIMTAFGHSFMQSDISIFKQNLLSLQDLNLKQKIFEKMHGSLSDEDILFQFVYCLIQALINKSHDLLIDDICMLLHTMCCVDFDYFHSNFLPQFLRNVNEVTADQKTTLYRNFTGEQDLPTFTKNLLQLTNDLSYYKLCNSSLPKGTIHF